MSRIGLIAGLALVLALAAALSPLAGSGDEPVSAHTTGSTATGVVDAQVSSSSDDAYDNPVCCWPGYSSSDIAVYAGAPGVSGPVWGGWRWTGLDIPEGAQVLDAYVELSQKQWGFIFETTLAFEDSAAPGTFSSDSPPSGRWGNRTQFEQAWTWDGQLPGTWHRTPDLSAGVQELIDSHGGINEIALIENGTGAPDGQFHMWAAYDLDPARAARLVVTYLIPDVEEPEPILAPELLTPADGAATDDTTPRFTWSAVANPAVIAYEIQVDSSDDFAPPLVAGAVVASTQHAVPDGEDLDTGQYFWRVRAMSGSENGPFSSVRSFAIFTACNGLPATIIGTSGEDILIGTEGDDVIAALAGDDVVVGMGGNDIICGDSEDDVLEGGLGNDLIIGGHGSDFLVGRDGDDVLQAGLGDDRLIGNLGDDSLECGEGDDLADAGSDSSADTDADVISPDCERVAPDVHTGPSGNRGAAVLVLDCSLGPDCVRVAGPVDDGPPGTSVEVPPDCRDEHAPTIAGTPGDDVIIGTSGDDVIVGLDGNDILIGAFGNDYICAGPGNDLLTGGQGRDRLFGEEGHDLLVGGGNIDRLTGDAGRDIIAGSDDDDTFRCGRQIDFADGGVGVDDTPYLDCETTVNIP